jgi:hypothetical protein
MQRAVRPAKLPDPAFLHAWSPATGAYADCYCIDVEGRVAQAAFIEAFYSTWLFKLERLLLAWFVARPSTDEDARRLGAGAVSGFAAWSVERQDAQQLLLCDFQGRTRSWLMAVPADDGASTRLYFGSAVVPVRDRATGETSLGFPFRALLGYHKLYSRLLLAAAARRLAR